MDKIKVLLVDDEKLIRDGLKIILSTYADIEVVGLCEDGEEAFEFCNTNQVDVVLLDIRMPKCNGVIGTKLIKEKFKDVKILILTTFNDTEYIHEALRYGASGYLLKDSSYDLIYEGIKASIKGSVVVHPEVAEKMIPNIHKEENDYKELEEYGLTERELSIIKEIAHGLTNKEIGKKLYLSEGTIKNNISTILSKLELRDRTQVVIFAFKNEIVT
ncbi:two component transcriptional regulator, LuxR family [Gottschalkia acidurici 9a]|uniref:Two component transcriptional regulator, LuxR family n=1 Tax=Gottschalkia acidurici (strain ATCC 7906 / DSM 604 / BCRC 14475 / CIP 104303 / KCTC 5404 / NCIMB 10678 / 9a) TaxID=1128398 RepID=K0B3X2_GOTA9|nr:response regulator transcription factor [Gottschalkia acidurici]AFS79615.1 two component transcriptional regulator, LuxR family [Gottschalkia acidurici 9a]